MQQETTRLQANALLVSDTEMLALVDPQYPDVNFILPHLGSFADDWRSHLRVIDQIICHPNVYTDTSGVRRFDYLEQAVKRGGAHKVLFGSDGPWLHPGLELHKVRLLELPPDQAALILGKNLLRLIRRVPTKATLQLIKHGNSEARRSLSF